jgi:hypothetical protein
MERRRDRKHTGKRRGVVKGFYKKHNEGGIEKDNDKSSELLLRHRNAGMGAGRPCISLPGNRSDRL